MIIFLCGMAASGKTTLAKQIAAERGAARLTLDERMIDKYPHLSIFDEEYGVRAAEEKEAMWQEALAIAGEGRDVILDWSLWSRQARRQWTQRALTAGHDYFLIYIEVPLDTLLKRVAARNAEAPASAHTIPLAEVVRFSKIFEPPTTDEDLNLEHRRG